MQQYLLKIYFTPSFENLHLPCSNNDALIDFSESPNTGHPNTGYVPKPDIFVSSF
jgi:hypothetical protein